MMSTVDLLSAMQDLFDKQKCTIEALQRRVQHQTNQYNRLFHRHQTDSVDRRSRFRK